MGRIGASQHSMRSQYSIWLSSSSCCISPGHDRPTFVVTIWVIYCSIVDQGQLVKCCTLQGIYCNAGLSTLDYHIALLALTKGHVPSISEEHFVRLIVRTLLEWVPNFLEKAVQLVQLGVRTLDSTQDSRDISTIVAVVEQRQTLSGS